MRNEHKHLFSNVVNHPLSTKINKKFQQMKIFKKSQHESSRRLTSERSLLKTKHTSQKYIYFLTKKNLLLKIEYLNIF